MPESQQVCLGKNRSGNAPFLRDVFKELTPRQSDKDDTDKSDDSREHIDDLLNSVLEAGVPHLVDRLNKKSGSALRRRSRILRGFRRRLRSTWGPGFELLTLLFELSMEAGAELNQQVGTSRQEHPQIDVLFRCHAKACQVAFEVLSLLENGYASGAHSRWRTLHELAVTALIIGRNDDALARRYVDHFHIMLYKSLKHYQRHCESLGYESVPQDRVEAMRATRDALVSKYGRAFGEDYGWASALNGGDRITFADLEQQAGLSHLRPYYRMACDYIHPGIRSLSDDLGLAECSPFVLLCGPSDAGMADPGHCAAISLTQVTCALLSAYPSVDGLFVMQLMRVLTRAAGEALMHSHHLVETGWALQD